MKYADYLRTPDWKRFRSIVIKKAQHRCQLCNSSGVLHVHHRNYADIFNEKLCDVVVLCADCHKIFHEHGKVKSIKISPDAKRNYESFSDAVLGYGGLSKNTKSNSTANLIANSVAFDKITPTMKYRELLKLLRTHGFDESFDGAISYLWGLTAQSRRVKAT
jgi:hypothetical protein